MRWFSVHDGREHVRALSAEQRVAECYTRYFGVILAKCTRMLADAQEAEDVAQETFIRFWRALGEAKDIDLATAWIYRTSTHLAIDRLRARKRRQQTATSETAPSLEGEVLSRELLARMAATIPEKELEAGILHRIDKLDQNEVALLLGVSTRQVRRRLEALDEKLRKL